MTASVTPPTTPLGNVTYTYGGSPTSTTNYTISVHLLTDNGAYIDAGSKSITVKNAVQAPTITSVTGLDQGGIDIAWTDANAQSNISYDIEVQYTGSSNWYLLTSRPRLLHFLPLGQLVH